MFRQASDDEASGSDFECDSPLLEFGNVLEEQMVDDEPVKTPPPQAIQKPVQKEPALSSPSVAAKPKASTAQQKKASVSIKKKKIEFKHLESESEETDEEVAAPKEKKRKIEKQVKKAPTKKPVTPQPSSKRNKRPSLSKQFTSIVERSRQKALSDIEVSSSDDEIYGIVPSLSQEMFSQEDNQDAVEEKLFSGIYFVLSSSLLEEKDKAELEVLIKNADGKIIHQLNGNNHEHYENKKMVLIADKTSTKPSYLIALLFEIPLLKKEWVKACVEKNELILNEKEVSKYLLDRGSFKFRTTPGQHTEKQTFNSSLVCCKREQRIFYGCGVKIVDHVNDKSLTSTWSPILMAGGAVIDQKLKKQTISGSNFIFVRQSSDLTEEDTKLAKKKRLPILDRESVLQIIITLERKFSEEHVINYSDLTLPKPATPKKTPTTPSRKLVDLSMPLIDDVDLSDKSFNLIETVETRVPSKTSGNFFRKDEMGLYNKTCFVRMEYDSSSSYCETFHLRDMVLLREHRGEVFCRIDSLYYEGNLPSMKGTQYLPSQNDPLKMVATDITIIALLSEIKFKVLLKTKKTGKAFYSDYSYNTLNYQLTKHQIEMPYPKVSPTESIESIMLTLDIPKKHKFKWIAPISMALYREWANVCGISWKGTIHQPGDFVQLGTKNNTVVGRITELREENVDVFSEPFKSFAISKGTIFLELFNKRSLDSEPSHYTPTHQVHAVNVSDLTYIRKIIVFQSDIYKSLDDHSSLHRECLALID